MVTAPRLVDVENVPNRTSMTNMLRNAKTKGFSGYGAQALVIQGRPQVDGARQVFDPLEEQRSNSAGRLMRSSVWPCA
jgi:hypothetical protein